MGNREVCFKVGKIIHDAVRDQAKREALVNDAKSTLAGAGITDPREIKIVEDNASEYYVMIPKEVRDEADFEGNLWRFENYLVELGAIVISGCKSLPEPDCHDTHSPVS